MDLIGSSFTGNGGMNQLWKRSNNTKNQDKIPQIWDRSDRSDSQFWEKWILALKSLVLELNEWDRSNNDREERGQGRDERERREGSMNREVKKWLCQELWEGDIGDRIDLKEERERRRCRIRMRLSEELLADKQTYGHIDNCLWIEQWRNREGKKAIKSSTTWELKSNQTQTYRFTL